MAPQSTPENTEFTTILVVLTNSYCLDFQDNQSRKILLHKVIFGLEKMEKCFEASIFLDNILKMPLSEHTQTSSWRHKITFATVRVIRDGIKFCERPDISYAKPHSYALTVM